MLESWYRDFALGLRALRNSPAFCFTAILTLALGIGANTAIFTLLYGLVLRSLPAPAASQLMQVGIASPAFLNGDRATFIPYRMLEQLRREQKSFRDISAWDGDMARIRDNEGSVRQYLAAMVSGNAFPLLELQPYLGRLISPYDDVRGGPPQGWPVVLSYDFWTDHYGRDPAIIGKQIKVSGVQVTIIGVTPTAFQGPWPGSDVKLYLPLQLEAILEHQDLNDPNSVVGVSAIGRLRPGVSTQQADAELALFQKELFQRFIPVRFQHSPFLQKAHLQVDSARSGLPTYVGRIYTRPLYLMQGLVGIVLLLCCVNIGGLMMSKVYARQHEFAVRTALGARSWRLVRQYLTESLVIAISGSILGALVAWFGGNALLHFFRDPMMGEALSVHPDQAIFSITGLFAVATTLLFGALPAWRAARSDPGALLKARNTLGGQRHIAGRTFVPVQVALSLVLVVFASLLSQSLVRIRSEHTGFDLDHVIIQTSPLHLMPEKGDAKLNLYQRMVDRVAEMPGIDSVAVTSQTPMTGVEITSHFQAFASGRNPPEDSHMPYNDVGPGYFRTMKTRIISGREFAKDERTLNVCILNQSAAAFFFPHQNPMGRYVKSLDQNQFPNPVTCRVIGLAEDAKFFDVRQPPPRTIYFPLSTARIDNLGNLVFLINSANKAYAMAAFRKALSEIAPSVPLVLFVSLKEQMDAALGSQRLITLITNFFGCVALLLSALGLYALLSASVVQRTGEIGVRIALGAPRPTVLCMILKEALTLLGGGIALGSLVLYFATRFVTAMLHGVSAFDPLTLVAVAVLLTIVTIIAALVPALRAATVDPIQALRAE